MTKISNCPICGLARSTMLRKGINFNTVRGQVYCEKHFLELANQKSAQCFVHEKLPKHHAQKIPKSP